jgi:hypothetical protein
MPRWPATAELIAWEQRSRRQGSGITPTQLRGSWRLDAVWNRQAQPLTSQAAGLRLLQAQLRLSPASSTADALLLTNSVRVGWLGLRFLGHGTLQGRRPLLRFSFETLELTLGERVLWRQRLAATPERQAPFFALIAAGDDAEGRWLLARGRGGGLALWRAQALGPPART